MRSGTTNTQRDNVRPNPLDTILVPLDGSPLAESAVPVAVRIARATGATLVLAHVVSNLTLAFAAETGLTSAEAYEELLAIEMHGAQDYLQRVASSMPAGVRVETTQVRGEPAPALMDLIEQLSVDLVA